jgi:hypothetical protein
VLKFVNPDASRDVSFGLPLHDKYVKLVLVVGRVSVVRFGML